MGKSASEETCRAPVSPGADWTRGLGLQSRGTKDSVGWGSPATPGLGLGKPGHPRAGVGPSTQPPAGTPFSMLLMLFRW